MDSINKEVSAICSMFEMKINRDFRLKSSFFVIGTIDNKDNYWVHELEVKYLHELEEMLIELGFEMSESGNVDKILDRQYAHLGDSRIIDLHRKKITTKVVYKMIENVATCPPPDMESWL